MKFSYDKSEFEAEIKDDFTTSLNKKYVQLVVSLFADNYKNEEFERLLGEAYQGAGRRVPTEFEMYYGGYNLVISVENASYASTNIYIKGEKR